MCELSGWPEAREGRETGGGVSALLVFGLVHSDRVEWHIINNLWLPTPIGAKEKSPQLAKRASSFPP